MGLFNECPVCQSKYVGRTCLACATPEAPPPTALVPQPGQIFCGMKIVSLLDRGGVGLVYKATQESLNRVVAVKILLPEKAVEFDWEARFLREAQALASLSHPNIVGIHDSGKEPLDPARGGGELYYLVMEYVEGRTLRQVLAEGAVPVDQAISIFSQVCEALDYAHGKKIVHRDIKPENVLVDAEGRVKVVDFGLVKLLGEVGQSQGLTFTGVVIGTTGYMAPEQVSHSSRVDHRADIYSAGVLLHELMTGRMPGERSGTSAIEPALTAVFSRALAEDPARRYGDIRELLRDIRGIEWASVRGDTIPADKMTKITDRPTSQTPSSPIPVPMEVQAWLDDRERALNQYVLVRQVGSGGMGTVWKAWDRKLARWVAVKFLTTVDEVSIRRFEREAQLAAQLRHPNIAAVYEVNQSQGRHFLVMDFIEGKALDKIELSLPDLIATMVKVCRAVGYAHQRSIIHRDIKPKNILVSAEGEPTVTDFGLAKVLDCDSSISVTGTIVGTPAFMSPEQAAGLIRDVDARSDVFSLGSSLYLLATRQHPFQGQHTAVLLRKIAEEDPIPPTKIRADLPRELEAVILKAMEKSKANRYATAAEMADDLERVFRKEEVVARAPGPVRRLFRRVARNPLPYAGGAALLLASVVAAAVVFRPRPKAETDKPPDPPAGRTWEEDYRAIQSRFALDRFREGSPTLIPEARRVILSMPKAERGKAIDWFLREMGRIRGIGNGVFEKRLPKKEWIAFRPEAKRQDAWCAAVLAVFDGLGKDFGPLCDEVREKRGPLQRILAYRGSITLKIAIAPYAEVRGLRVGEDWVIRDGKRLRTEATVVGDSLYTPLGIRDLDIGDYTLILAHPQYGEKAVSLKGKALENGKTYIVSGSMKDPRSIGLHPLP